MQSIQSKLVYYIARSRKGKLSDGNNIFDCPEPPRKMRTKYKVTNEKVHNRNVFTIQTNGRPSNIHILYLHGGAYTLGFFKQHWQLMGSLVDSLDCTITAPDYPLAPDHTYEESFAMVMEIYKNLIARLESGRLILMGDSAGAGFALALSQKVRDENLSQPEQIILLSPWLDITLTNPEVDKIAPYDPFLDVETLQRVGKEYAGNTDPNYHLLSPINGAFDGLGKISLFTGTKDILSADARKLKSLLSSQGIPINFYEYKNMIHVWMLFNFPESKKALKQIIALIKENI